jgi:hypothetical protein
MPIILQIEDPIARIEIKIRAVPFAAMRNPGGKVSLRQFCLPNLCPQIIKLGKILCVELACQSQRNGRSPKHRARHFQSIKACSEVNWACLIEIRVHTQRCSRPRSRKPCSFGFGNKIIQFLDGWRRETKTGGSLDYKRKPRERDTRGFGAAGSSCSCEFGRRGERGSDTLAYFRQERGQVTICALLWCENNHSDDRSL